MEWCSLRSVLVVLGLACCLRSAVGIRFVIDREECFSHSVPYEGDKVHFSFVVIKSDTPWHKSGDEGVDLVARFLMIDQTIVHNGTHRFIGSDASVSYLQEAVDSDRTEMERTHYFIGSDASIYYLQEALDPDHIKVKGPSGDQIYDARDKTSDKFEFVVQKKGIHRFCFTNKSPYHENIDFDVYIGHFSYFEEHAKDEHVNPLMEQIQKLEEALYNIQFEQHWLEAQTDRQALVNERMSRRAIHKALFESAALIGVSVLQVYLLRRLFERKLGTSRV